MVGRLLVQVPVGVLLFSPLEPAGERTERLPTILLRALELLSANNSTDTFTLCLKDIKKMFLYVFISVVIIYCRIRVYSRFRDAECSVQS